eukprot:9228725-Pyramimonas_sp.AAC.1
MMTTSSNRANPSDDVDGIKRDESRTRLPRLPTTTTTEDTHVSCVRLVRHENISACLASDWSVVRICPRRLVVVYAQAGCCDGTTDYALRLGLDGGC